MKKLSFYFALIFLSGMIFSCDKNDETDASCSDGYQNQGETGVDCGGPCSPCNQIGGVPYMYAFLEDSNNVFQNVQAVKIADTFRFSMTNSFTELKFGIYFIPNHDASEDSALMLPNSYSAKFGAAEFDVPFIEGGNSVMGAVMVENQALSTVEGNYYFSVTNASGNDTINVVNGQFFDIVYE